MEEGGHVTNHIDTRVTRQTNVLTTTKHRVDTERTNVKKHTRHERHIKDKTQGKKTNKTRNRKGKGREGEERGGSKAAAERKKKVLKTRKM